MRARAYKHKMKNDQRNVNFRDPLTAQHVFNHTQEACDNSKRTKYACVPTAACAMKHGRSSLSSTIADVPAIMPNLREIHRDCDNAVRPGRVHMHCHFPIRILAPEISTKLLVKHKHMPIKQKQKTRSLSPRAPGPPELVQEDALATLTHTHTHTHTNTLTHTSWDVTIQ